MKTHKHIAIFLCFAVIICILSGCGTANYNDGTYEGKSSLHEGNGDGDGYGIAKITLDNNKIVACEFKTYQTDGTLKDENYGKQNGEIANTDFYNKAQRAVIASQKYADQLAKVGDLKKVDAVSGATISYSEFKEAVEDALSKAKK